MTIKEFMDRYGPTVAVLALLGLLAVLLPGNARGGESDDLTADGGETITTSVGAAGGTTEAVGGVDGTAGGEAAAGTVAASGGPSVPAGGGTRAARTTTGASGTGATGGQQTVTPTQVGGVTFGAGPNCREDGRQKSFSYSAPPCADWKPGTPNGGATSRGVTGDTIRVIRYRGQENAATQAALTGAGATDNREDTERQYQLLTRYFNQHYETYGRQVELKVFDATGTAGNDEAARADAIHIAEKLGAFAVLNASNVAAEELARRGVICVCTTSLSRAFYTALPPYIFSSLPTSEGYGEHRAEYVGKRLARKNAQWAGDPAYRAQPRKFGYIWYEGEEGRADPIRRVGRDAFIAELAKYNVKLTAEASFIFDIANAPNQAQSMIAKMKNEGVSHLMLATDPLYPIFITQQASNQAYYPEWGFSGTALTDTTFFGRTYDKVQMQAAFGISPLYVSWADCRTSPGMKELRHADPAENDDCTDGKVAVNVNRSPVAILFAGIHMAGPKLTADSFAQGLFSMPAIGGTAARPLIKFTRQDPTAIKDFTEIFWDSTQTGRDEVNKDGAGAWLKVDGGKRYQHGQWPATDPKVFNTDGAVFTSDNPPGGPQATPHDADGHKHDPNKKCLSCVG